MPKTTPATDPQLGLATTRQLLAEIVARVEPVIHQADWLYPTLDLAYSTAAGARGMHLEDSNLVEHARRELWNARANLDAVLAASLVRTVQEFATQGHSGCSADMAIEILTRLLRFEPLTPLTSDPAEWQDRSVESGVPLWQNRRDPRAMSDDGGKTWWYTDGRYAGDRCKDGDRWGVLERCAACSGSGLLHRPDGSTAAEPPAAAEAAL